MRKRLLYALFLLLPLATGAALLLLSPQWDAAFWVILVSSEISLLGAQGVTLWALGDRPKVYHGTVALYGWMYFLLTAAVNYQCGHRMGMEPLPLIIIHGITLALCASILLIMTAPASKISKHHKENP